VADLIGKKAEDHGGGAEGPLKPAMANGAAGTVVVGIGVSAARSLMLLRDLACAQKKNDHNEDGALTSGLHRFKMWRWATN